MHKPVPANEALIVAEASAGAFTGANEPKAEQTGVRRALTITASWKQ